jgi:hypothetical protein
MEWKNRRLIVLLIYSDRMHFCSGILAVETQLKRRGRNYSLSLSKKKLEIIFRVIDLMGRIK